MSEFGRFKGFYVGLALIVFGLPISQALGISRKDFFERLDRSMSQIRTFESDIQQESRYLDGLVQRYSGHLTLFEDGRIAYRYDLVGEYEDPSLVPESGINRRLVGDTRKPSHRVPSSGRIFAKQGRVRHFDAEKDLVIEGTEDTNLLIQVFRTLVGAGDFDVDKFRKEHSIKVEETTLDGIPVYRMIASPKKRSELFRKWSSKTRNEMMNWNWELWVKQSNMEPVKAVLQSLDLEESTTIYLHATRINEPVDEEEFTLPKGANPQVIPEHSLAAPLSGRTGEAGHRSPEVSGLQEIPTE